MSIQCVERALDILNLLNEKGGKMGVSEIARILDLHKSTVHRTLNTLQSKDYVYRDEKTGLYSLGVAAFVVGFTAANHLPLARLARPYMAYLSEKYSEYVVLSVLVEKIHIFIITNYLGSYSTTFFSAEQQRANNDSYRPAIVHCILANQGRLEANNQILANYLSYQSKRRWLKNGVRTMDELLHRLQKVKEQGYDIEDGEFRPDEICYAVPIFDKGGQIQATLSIFGSKSRLAQFEVEDIIHDLQVAADSIQQG